jgi:signal transduction histidine kinase
MESERQLTVDASHQLRSPLTAVSMRLEEILRSDDLGAVHEEATAALEQVARLSGVVDDLMVRRTFGPSELPLPVADVVQQQVSEWERAYASEGRAIRAVDDATLATPVPRGAVNQVLACLLENSLEHGVGLTTVRTRRLAGAVCIEVTDEGPGVPAELASQVFDRWVSGSGSGGTGVGLAMARSTAEAVNGRLELVTARPARFALFLPTVPLPAASGRRSDLGEDPAAVGPEPEGGAEADPDDVGGDVVRDG